MGVFRGFYAANWPCFCAAHQTSPELTWKMLLFDKEFEALAMVPLEIPSIQTDWTLEKTEAWYSLILCSVRLQSQCIMLRQSAARCWSSSPPHSPWCSESPGIVQHSLHKKNWATHLRSLGNWSPVPLSQLEHYLCLSPTVQIKRIPWLRKEIRHVFLSVELIFPVSPFCFMFMDILEATLATTLGRSSPANPDRWLRNRPC